MSRLRLALHLRRKERDIDSKLIHLKTAAYDPPDGSKIHQLVEESRKELVEAEQRRKASTVGDAASVRSLAMRPSSTVM